MPLGKYCLMVGKFENSLRKISLPRQRRNCPESVALGAGAVATASRENRGKVPPPEVEQLWRELLFALFVAFASPVHYTSIEGSAIPSA